VKEKFPLLGSLLRGLDKILADVKTSFKEPYFRFEKEIDSLPGQAERLREHLSKKNKCKPMWESILAIDQE
jgi:hypothetical protein